jgi:hypothetical protein
LPSLDQDGPSGRRLLFLFCPLFGKTELRVKILIFLELRFFGKRVNLGNRQAFGAWARAQKARGPGFRGQAFTWAIKNLELKL